MNLLRNASTALRSTANAKIHVRLEKSAENPKEALLVVADNGPKLKPEAVRAVTEPFTGYEGESMGYGLLIVREITANHGGTVSFETPASGGLPPSPFGFLLRRTALRRRDPILNEHITDMTDSVDTIAGDREIIRLVDDDPAVLDSLGFMLECEGYTVKTFTGPMAFLRGDSPSDPGCIVLDLQMPEMDGLELLREMMRRGYNVPIVFLSAHGDLRSAVSAMKLGSLDFFEKPLDEEAFLTFLREVLEKERRKRTVGRDDQAAAALVAKLSERERHIAELLASGLVKRQVAERLGISAKTVNSHAEAIYSKLGVHSVRELGRLLDAAKCAETA